MQHPYGHVPNFSKSTLKIDVVCCYSLTRDIMCFIGIALGLASVEPNGNPDTWQGSTPFNSYSFVGHLGIVMFATMLPRPTEASIG